MLRDMERARLALALASPEARGAMLQFEAALDAFHRAAIKRLVDGLRRNPLGLQMLLALADDPLIHALLAHYGVVKPDLRTRARSVLAAFEPQLAAMRGAAELAEVTQHHVLVRLRVPALQPEGTVTALRQQIEHALRTQLLECKTVEVVAADATPEPRVPGGREIAGAASVPAPSFAMPAAPRADPGWALGPRAAEITEAAPCRVDTGTMSVLLIRAKGQLHAFVNECSHLGLPLDGGQVDLASGVLTCPWHGFRYECATGKCITNPGSKLDAIPFRIEDGYVLVKLA